MSKEIYISSTPHETRLAIVENDALTEIYYERENEYTLAGSIYNGRVTRVLPGMQSSFVDIGLERDAFLYITDFMEEAGDSADFEANANAGDSRAPRNERGGERKDRGERNGRERGDRGGRSDQPRLAAPAAEPTDADLFTQAVSSLDPARPSGDADRNGNRRGGRNRRDRNFNSDGTPRRDRGDFNRADTPHIETPRIQEPVSDFTPETTVAPPDQLGEAAPGADGSRRWRGRRGRRGNRGREEFGPPAQAQDQIPVETAPTYDEPIYEVGAVAAPIEALPAERTPREGRRDRERNRGAQQPSRASPGLRSLP